MTPLETVQKYVNAWNARELDSIVGMFTEDGLMTSPMGPQKGKVQIRSTTSMFLAMTSKHAMTDAYIEDDLVRAKIKAPVGMVNMVFTTKDNLIQRIDSKISLR